MSTLANTNDNNAASSPPRSLFPLEEKLLLNSQPVLPSGQHRAYSTSDLWRVLQIQRELIIGFDALAHIPPAVAIFGSARTSPDSPDYEAAVETASRLSQAGFGIITGGGPGMMEAANKGAQAGGSCSIGCAIELSAAEPPNAYLDLSLSFRSFFVRKTMFITYAHAFIIFPGGFGTIDELFEVLNLIQNKKVRSVPVILAGTSYWRGLLVWLRETVLLSGKISPEDMDLFCLSDDPQEMCQMVVHAFQKYSRSQQPSDHTNCDQAIR